MPKPSTHHRLLSLEVTSGFLSGVKFEFADGLNCIIGGRGTGKTTALQFMRYALGVTPEEANRPTDNTASLLQSNLKTGRIRLRLQTKDGEQYIVERPYNDRCQVLDADGHPTSPALSPNVIFPVDAYSQNQIEEIAADPTKQLPLIDKFEDEKMRELRASERSVLLDLKKNASKLMTLDLEKQHDVHLSEEVNDLKQKLKPFNKATTPDATELVKAQQAKAQRNREEKALDRFRECLEKIGQDFSATSSGSVRRLGTLVDDDLLQSKNSEVFQQVAEAIESISKKIQKATADVRSECESTFDEHSSIAEKLRTLHADQDLVYRKQMETSRLEQEKVDARIELENRLLIANTARKELDAKEQETDKLRAERQGLLTHLSDLRDKRFELREKTADVLTKNNELHKVKVEVSQSGDWEQYRKLLKEALWKENQHVAINRIIDNQVTPEELADAVITRDGQRLVADAKLTADAAHKLIDKLRTTEALYDIQTVELGDLPIISLQDGTEWKRSPELSAGQRCTTILAILLYQDSRPLLIDQPEDNLDNAYIYDTVVKSVENAKGMRQLIFVTHNPNIPVLGDAEKIFVLKSDGKQVTLVAEGPVDASAVKVQVEDLLEGGQEAFEMRRKKYRKKGAE